jgi:ATP-dependent Clp protease ATP-binding subunit ClpB
LLALETELHKRVIGQQEAIEAVSDSIRRSRAGLQDAKKPIGSFLFLGTTGVGKTELAKALAEYLFDDENAITRIDMSEYQERHSVSRLVGAPPGYVGYDEGGQLTEAVRRKPYSVVLLDEIEKAHPDTFNILLQVLDEGRLTDNKGRVADFKNSIIIMTSNIGSDVIQQQIESLGHNAKALEKAKIDILSGLRQTVRLEFLNRIDDIVMFEPLTEDHLTSIVELQLKSVQKLLNHQSITLDATPEAKWWLAKKGFDPLFGARPVKRVIQSEVVNKLSKSLLSGELKTDSMVLVDCFDNELVFRNEHDLVRS